MTHLAKEEWESKPNVDLNKRVSIFVGDITQLEIDVIVNAANTGLWAGAGGRWLV